ncbi:MAG: DUF4367 domain-containing protein [Clostridiales bacterium]|nr:DUF4367 domain-containing protein [Clostridiales bacterium]
MSNEQRRPAAEGYEAQVIAHAFQTMLSAECEALQKEPLSAEEEELLQQAAAMRPKRLKQIDSSLRQKTSQKQLKKRSFGPLKYIALLLLMAVLSFGTALAVSPALRVQLVDILQLVPDEYVTLGPTGMMVSAPAGWRGEYFPAYVPEEYELVSCYSTEQFSKVTYQNENAQRIVYQISATRVTTQLDAENSICRRAIVNNHEGYLYTTKTQSTLMWYDGSIYHAIVTPTTDMALDILESFALVKHMIP